MSRYKFIPTKRGFPFQSSITLARHNKSEIIYPCDEAGFLPTRHEVERIIGILQDYVENATDRKIRYHNENLMEHYFPGIKNMKVPEK